MLDGLLDAVIEHVEIFLRQVKDELVVSVHYGYGSNNFIRNNADLILRGCGRCLRLAWRGVSQGRREPQRKCTS